MSNAEKSGVSVEDVKVERLYSSCLDAAKEVASAFHGVRETLSPKDWRARGGRSDSRKPYAHITKISVEVDGVPYIVSLTVQHDGAGW